MGLSEQACSFLRFWRRVDLFIFPSLSSSLFLPVFWVVGWYSTCVPCSRFPLLQLLLFGRRSEGVEKLFYTYTSKQGIKIAKQEIVRVVFVEFHATDFPRTSGKSEESGKEEEERLPSEIGTGSFSPSSSSSSSSSSSHGLLGRTREGHCLRRDRREKGISSSSGISSVKKREKKACISLSFSFLLGPPSSNACIGCCRSHLQDSKGKTDDEGGRQEKRKKKETTFFPWAKKEGIRERPLRFLNTGYPVRICKKRNFQVVADSKVGASIKTRPKVVFMCTVFGLCQIRYKVTTLNVVYSLNMCISYSIMNNKIYFRFLYHSYDIYILSSDYFFKAKESSKIWQPFLGLVSSSASLCSLVLGACND